MYARHKKIRVSIVVEIGNRRRHRITGALQSGRLRYVPKLEIAHIAV